MLFSLKHAHLVRLHQDQHDSLWRDVQHEADATGTAGGSGGGASGGAHGLGQSMGSRRVRRRWEVHGLSSLGYPWLSEDEASDESAMSQPHESAPRLGRYIRLQR